MNAGVLEKGLATGTPNLPGCMAAEDSLADRIPKFPLMTLRDARGLRVSGNVDFMLNSCGGAQVRAGDKGDFLVVSSPGSRSA